MVYRAIGLMSGSSLDGLDIVYVEFHENGGKWTFDIQQAECLVYPQEWAERLKNATELSARAYQLLHCEYGRFLGESVNQFITAHALQYKVALIGSHGHTTFHEPDKGMTAQLGDGGAIAAETGLPVVTDLRAMDVALGGQGAPIVPIGERLLLNQYQWFLNLGGIANISWNNEKYIAFDVCPANRVLNLLAAEAGKLYDEGGALAATGKVNAGLLQQLDGLSYYALPAPKSLANDFGIDVVYPIIKAAAVSIEDGLRTFAQHIVNQICAGLRKLKQDSLSLHPQQAGGAESITDANSSTGNGTSETNEAGTSQRMLVTGGGAFNTTVINLLRDALREFSIEVVVPDEKLIQYKEAVIMALIGVLRWREEVNVFSSVTGARRDSVGGAMWMGEG